MEADLIWLDRCLRAFAYGWAFLIAGFFVTNSWWLSARLPVTALNVLLAAVLLLPSLGAVIVADRLRGRRG